MKGLAWVLLVFYLFVTILWVSNSPYLFSMLGVTSRLISILLGFIAYKQLKEKNTIKQLILYSELPHGIFACPNRFYRVGSKFYAIKNLKSRYINDT